MRLSTGQVEVLRALSSGKKITSNVTIGEMVSGTASAALEKRGLVKRTEKNGTTTVTITPAGRKELKDAAARAKARSQAVAKRKPAAKKARASA